MKLRRRIMLLEDYWFGIKISVVDGHCSKTMYTRERTISARTDTIRYEYSSIHNCRYDTSTPCVGVPATGRLENEAYTHWVAHTDH